MDTWYLYMGKVILCVLNIHDNVETNLLWAFLCNLVVSIPMCTYLYFSDWKVRNIYKVLRNTFLEFKYANILKSVHKLQQLENVSLWLQSLLCMTVKGFFPFIVHNRAELKCTPEFLFNISYIGEVAFWYFL